MTHEQKPESAEFLRNARAMQAKVKRRLADRTKRAEFRTRREQIAFYPETVCVGRYAGNSWQLEISEDDLDPDRLIEGPVMYVRCDIDHKRRKDAEGAERWEVERRITEAVAVERAKSEALIRSLATGYERMRRVLVNMSATSGPDASRYRRQADQGVSSVPVIWDIARNPVEAKPGECAWINRDGSMAAIREGGEHG